MLIGSIIRKSLRLKRLCMKKISEEHSYMVLYLDPERRCRPSCSYWNTKRPGYETLKKRRWTHVPCWGIPVILVYAPSRVRCAKCGIKVEAIP